MGFFLLLLHFEKVEKVKQIIFDKCNLILNEKESKKNKICSLMVNKMFLLKDL